MIIKTLKNLQIVGSKDYTILDSALNSGHFLEYSCKNGQCGACKTVLLEGEVIELQPQLALSEEDRVNNKFLTCCCSPKTDVLIDAEDLSLLKGIDIKTLPARINRIERRTENIIEVELRLQPTANFIFLEGQYIDIIGSGNIRRSYSLANSSSQGLITLFIKKVENGLLSKYWFEDAKENDLLRIEGPKGTFFLRDRKKHIIFLATGTGIAPLKSILEKLTESGELGGDMDLSLYWGNRHAEDFFWKPAYSNLKYTPVVSKEGKGWPTRVGYVQDIAMEDKLDMENTQVYACGSIQMIEAAHRMFVDRGLDDKQFYSDAFVSS